MGVEVRAVVSHFLDPGTGGYTIPSPQWFDRGWELLSASALGAVATQGWEHGVDHAQS